MTATHEHDVLRHEDQAVPEERADRRHVGRRTAEELTRLVVVVVLLLERQQVAVDAGAQVVLDIEREPPRERATRHQHDRLDRAGEDDEADQDPQPLAVLARHRIVDDAAREPRNDEAERL